VELIAPNGNAALHALAVLGIVLNVAAMRFWSDASRTPTAAGKTGWHSESVFASCGRCRVIHPSERVAEEQNFGLAVE
jgi:hypothetical protein